MQNTGEQLIPGQSSQRLELEHLERYSFALQYCNNMSVLDIACGSGYGSSILSEKAKKVIGVDISKKSIDYAKNRYKKDNLEFVEGDCAELNMPEGSFDVIVSFETIEHLSENQRELFLERIKRFLKSDGKFILSTPNKKVTSPYTVTPLNKYHIIEFTRRELENEIKKSFNKLSWFGQRYISSFLLIKMIRKMTRVFEILLRKDVGIYTTLFTPVVQKERQYSQPRIFVLIAEKE